MDSLSSNEYANLVTKGRALYNQLLEAVSRTDTQAKSLPEISPHYELDIDASDGTFLSDPTANAITEAGHPTSEYVFIQAGNPPAGNSSTQQYAYQNYVHKKGKAILCMNNYAVRDSLLGRPEQIFFSDMVAVCYSRVVSDYGGEATSLEAIWRVFIDNKVLAICVILYLH